MKTLIAYGTKTGTARACAVRLAGLLPDEDVHVCDLSLNKPDLALYDMVVVGGSVRMGSIHPAVKKFLHKNEKALLQKRAAYFICNCFLGQSRDILKKNIPEPLWNSALCLDSFGGVMNLEQQKGVDRAIVGIVSKAPIEGDPPATEILEDRIAAFAEVLRARP